MVSLDSASFERSFTVPRIILAEEYRKKKKFEETKFIFPNAPNIPITINTGMKYSTSPSPATIRI